MRNFRKSKYSGHLTSGYEKHETGHPGYSLPILGLSDISMNDKEVFPMSTRTPIIHYRTNCPLILC